MEDFHTPAMTWLGQSLCLCQVGAGGVCECLGLVLDETDLCIVHSCLKAVIEKQHFLANLLSHLGLCDYFTGRPLVPLAIEYNLFQVCMLMTY